MCVYDEKRGADEKGGKIRQTTSRSSFLSLSLCLSLSLSLCLCLSVSLSLSLCLLSLSLSLSLVSVSLAFSLLSLSLSDTHARMYACLHTHTHTHAHTHTQTHTHTQEANRVLEEKNRALELNNKLLADQLKGDLPLPFSFLDVATYKTINIFLDVFVCVPGAKLMEGMYAQAAGELASLKKNLRLHSSVDVRS